MKFIAILLVSFLILAASSCDTESDQQKIVNFFVNTDNKAVLEKELELNSEWQALMSGNFSDIEYLKQLRYVALQSEQNFILLAKIRPPGAIKRPWNRYVEGKQIRSEAMKLIYDAARLHSDDGEEPNDLLFQANYKLIIAKQEMEDAFVENGMAELFAENNINMEWIY